MSEADLIRELRAGRDDAFESLLRTYGGRMLAVARRLLRNEEDARDALQDAMISVYRSIDRFHGEAKLSTWLHRIVVNAALMRLRSGRREEEEDIEPLLPKFRADGHQVESTIPWRGADDAMQEKELQDFVRRAIEKLPMSYRVVLILRDIEELTPDETAEALGISKTAVKVRLHRARQALRTLLDPQMRNIQ